VPLGAARSSSCASTSPRRPRTRAARWRGSPAAAAHAASSAPALLAPSCCASSHRPPTARRSLPVGAPYPPRRPLFAPHLPPPQVPRELSAVAHRVRLRLRGGLRHLLLPLGREGDDAPHRVGRQGRHPADAPHAAHVRAAPPDTTSTSRGLRGPLGSLSEASQRPHARRAPAARGSLHLTPHSPSPSPPLPGGRRPRSASQSAVCAAGAPRIRQASRSPWATTSVSASRP
jgi:hypothetical protein